MNRRGFFKSLMGAGALPAAAALSTAAAVAPASTWPTEDQPYHFISNGSHWLCHWTGWKGDVATAFLIGQWLAWPIEAFQPKGDWEGFPAGRYFYVNVPGFELGQYNPGAQFNISSHGRFVTTGTSQEQRDAWIAQGWGHLQDLVRRAAVPVPEPKYKFGFTGFRNLPAGAYKPGQQFQVGGPYTEK